MNSSIPVKRKLRVGFKTTLDPYLGRNPHTGAFRGSRFDQWKTYASQRGFDSVELVEYSPNNLDILNDVQFTSEAQYIDETTECQLKHTTTANNGKMYLIEQIRKNDSWISNISFFIVFPIEIIILGVACYVAFTGIKRIRSRYSAGRVVADRTMKVRFLLIVTDLLTAMAIEVAVVMAYQLYGGFYSGNTLYMSEGGSTTFSEAMANLLMGTRELVVLKGNNPFLDDEMEKIAGSVSAVRKAETLEELFTLICTNGATMAFVNYQQLTSFRSSNLSLSCTTNIIVPPSSIQTGLLFLDKALTFGDEYAYSAGLGITKKDLEVLSFNLLTVYSQPLMESLHLRRWLSGTALFTLMRNSMAKVKELPPDTAASINTMLVPLVMYLVLNALSFCCLVAERIHYRRTNRNTESLSIIV